MKNLIAISIALFYLISCGKKSSDVKPQYKDITEMVFASGALEPVGKYNLTAQTEGYLIKLNFEEGMEVNAGDLLAVIDNQPNMYSDESAEDLLAISKENFADSAPLFKQTEANIAFAVEKLKQDELQFERFKKLLDTKSISRLEFENVSLALENSKMNLKNYRNQYKIQKQQAEQQYIAQKSQRNINSVFKENNNIKAVIGGRVYKKFKEEGDYVRRGDIVAVIGAANELYARLNIDESNISKIKLGQKAIIQLNTIKGVNYEGIVDEILPAFEEASQSFICKLKFVKESPTKIMGTQLQANIIIGTKNRAFVIPREFLDYGNKVRLKGVKEAVVVKTGFISSEWVEVLAGLKEEDVLIAQQ